MRIRLPTSPHLTRRVPRRGNRRAWIPESGGIFDDCRGELALIAERRAAERAAREVTR